jgi:hypothetical protein
VTEGDRREQQAGSTRGGPCRIGLAMAGAGLLAFVGPCCAALVCLLWRCGTGADDWPAWFTRYERLWLETPFVGLASLIAGAAILARARR